MQQMSNILLGVGSKSADASLKNNMQDVENTSFLSAFNQASERSLVVKHPLTILTLRKLNLLLLMRV